ncbi:MAG: hypothetical protein CYPHOPRED_002076 [Cyphobasidiales sp. Tagirdzhanova-0007]|nr:MAG: hypothetical protein CYPHOPRED_002076 [Cyphobasidiales sp. Tagirdzhanova-0007]
MERATRLIKGLQVPREAEDFAKEGVYANRDTLPLPPARRTYGPWSFVGLWVLTGSFNIGGYTTGSALLSLGLNVWEAMLVVIIGYSLCAAVCLGTGMPGAEWHIGFPILQRSSWGMRGSYFPLVIRIMQSVVWCSVQVYWGGEVCKTLIGAIWPSFYNVDKSLASGTMQASDFIGFIIFTIICIPVIWVPPEKYHNFFVIASVSIFICVWAMFGWAIHAAHGIGVFASDAAGAEEVKPAKGAALGWAFVYGVSTMLGGIAVHLFNQSDYTRFARKPGDQILSQAIMVPIGAILNALIGIIVTSCAAQLYPEEGLLWQPYDLLTAIQKHSGNSGRARAAVAFASIAFILAQIGLAVVQNALSGGIDLAGLFPRWFTLRRGGYLTLALSFVVQPWQALNGASIFLSVIGSFSTFLSPMIAILIADYFVVRRRKLSLTQLFTNNEKSIYWFYHGVNPRTVVCFIVGTAPFMPGLVANINHKNLGGWTHLYYIGFPLGFAITFTLYVASIRIWPIESPTLYDDDDVFHTFSSDKALGAHPVSTESLGGLDKDKEDGTKSNIFAVV